MHNTETEYKFLVNDFPLGVDLKRPCEIVQIYFDGTKKIKELQELFPDVDLELIDTFRVRMVTYYKNSCYIATLKTKGAVSRDEYEVHGSKEKITSLYTDNMLSIVIKNRYVMYHKTYCFEFDEYLNLNTPLITVEVEINQLDCGEKKQEIIDILTNDFKLNAIDVTCDNRYKNSNITKYF